MNLLFTNTSGSLKVKSSDYKLSQKIENWEFDRHFVIVANQILAIHEFNGTSCKVHLQ